MLAPSHPLCLFSKGHGHLLPRGTRRVNSTANEGKTALMRQKQCFIDEFSAMVEILISNYTFKSNFPFVLCKTHWTQTVEKEEILTCPHHYGHHSENNFYCLIDLSIFSFGSNASKPYYCTQGNSTLFPFQLGSR